jgi:GNAT superfamily N-acetyltransferase
MRSQLHRKLRRFGHLLARVHVGGIEDMSLMMTLHLDVLCGNPEPDQFIFPFYGDIYGDGESIGDDNDRSAEEPKIKVGEIQLYLVDHARILNEKESLFDAMDDLSYETAECYDAIIDEDTGDWKEEVKGLIGEDACFRHNILLINRVELDEKFRGRGVGKQVVEEIIKGFGSGCAVIACKPFPLQYIGYGRPEHEEKRKAPGYEQIRLKAFAKVERFWKKQEFRKLPSSDHWVWIEKTARKRKDARRR